MKVKRKCESCGKVWFCNLECGYRERLSKLTWCHCKICYHEDLKTYIFKQDLTDINLFKCIRVKKGFVFR